MDMQKLKALGLALVAVFAMSAVVASAAQAATAFTAEKVPAEVTGTQTAGNITGLARNSNQFTTTHGTVICTGTTFTGTVTEAVSTKIKLIPAYAGCKLSGLAATVTMTSCFYEFTAKETDEGSPERINVTTEIKCTTAGDKIDVKVTGSECQVTVFPQTLSGVTLDNSGVSSPASGMDILATIDVQGIDYTVDNPTKCPNPSDVTSHTEEKLASYEGLATLQAHVPGAPASPIGITVH
jgi:hypothetical protein